MSKKLLAMLLMLVLTVGCVGDVSYAAEPSKEQQAISETVSAGDNVHAVDISANLLHKGGFLKDTSLSEEGYHEDKVERYLAVDQNTAQSAKTVIKAAYDSFAAECDLSQFQLTAEEVNDLIVEILNTEPRYFYVNGYYEYYYDTTTGYVTSLFNIRYEYLKSEATKMLAAYDAAVEQALSGASMDWSDMEKALYINDYLARNCEYDTNYTNYTAYDALVNQVAVCQGYTLACVELANQLGLACEMVSSDSMNHAWNLIRVNGKYYHLDVTWNDPLNNYLGRVNHFYLMKSTEYFKSEEAGHFQQNDWVITGGLTAADASDTSYDNYFWNVSDTGFDYIDGYWYGFDGLETIVKYSCDGTAFYEEEYLVTIDDTWYVTGTDSFYQLKFPGFGAYKEVLYISITDRIFSYDLSTRELVPEYIQTEEDVAEGSIYGLYIASDGTIHFQVGRSYDEPGQIYMVVYPSNEYTITYQLKGGTNHSSNPAVYTEDSETIVLKKPTRTGYTFGGWYKESSYKNKVTKIVQGSCGDLTLYAKWTPNKYTIQFAGNGATGGKMTSLKNRKYGTSYKLTANKFKRSGYTFKGWNTQKNGKGKTYKNQASVKNLTAANGKSVTLYAQWKKESYKITYKLNGGSNHKSNPKKYDVTTSKITLKAPTRKGYTFKGWYSDSKCKKRVKVIKKGSTGNITLYAKWSKK